ncbi:MAG: 3-phosphoglycerate dehydrogenase, partial [Acetatifactor sp.]|nr:3-phosphoglycerate dehydrogenase [Acetatifactor sp.]
MYKINCLNPISKEGLSKLTADYALTDEINEAEGILVRSASMHEMELPGKLLAVARAGAGTNNIPLDKCAEQGIVVFNTPGANANGVKELVIAGMLLAARDVVGGIEWVKASQEDENIAKAAEKE